MSVEEKFFAMNGGEISLTMRGKWYIVEIIRQVTSPYHVKYEKSGNDFELEPWDWNTIVTFDYPCLPREQITVRLSLQQNGIERAAQTIKNN